MKQNEYVSYVGHGLGQITEMKMINGIEFLSIRILDSGIKILIPSTNREYIRPLMSIDEARQCRLYLESPGEYMPNLKPASWKRRYDLLLAKLKSNNPIRIAEVWAEIMSRRNDGEDVTFGERKMMDTARSLIEAEILLVLQLPRGINQ